MQSISVSQRRFRIIRAAHRNLARPLPPVLTNRILCDVFCPEFFAKAFVQGAFAFQDAAKLFCHGSTRVSVGMIEATVHVSGSEINGDGVSQAG